MECNDTIHRAGTDSPRIYVASLAAYNAGILHGAWIDATQDADAIADEVSAMLQDCPEHGEEWAIHDFEGFGGIRIGEWESFADVSAYASLLDEFGDVELSEEWEERFRSLYMDHMQYTGGNWYPDERLRECIGEELALWA